MKLVAPWRKKQGKPGRIGIGTGSDYVSLVYMDQPNRVSLCQFVVGDDSAGVGLDNCQVSVSCTELTPDRGGTFYDIEAEGQCAYGAETDDSAVRVVRMQAKL